MTRVHLYFLTIDIPHTNPEVGSEIVSTLFYASPTPDGRRDSTQAIPSLTSNDLIPQTREDGTFRHSTSSSNIFNGELVVETQSARGETEGQREDERFDLDAKRHPDRMGADEDEPGDSSEGTETEDERLRVGVEQMNRRIAELERQLQMVQQDFDSAPPSYCR